MSQLDIVYLDSYRTRRDARFRRAVSLHGHDGDRTQLLHYLWEALALAGGDRGAVIWVDEYGPGLAHPHTVLDLGADRPRRLFSPVPLRAAWETRVPGLLDLPQTRRQWGNLGQGIASACAVALGCDGPRNWFLVVDSLTPRRALAAAVAGDLMFLAGEMASVVLHRDLGEGWEFLGSASSTEAARPGRGQAFPGWSVLEDLEGRQSDEQNRIIRDRFLVVRVLRGLVEDELVVEAESVLHQVENTRLELGRLEGPDPEVQNWDRVLRAVGSFDFQALMAETLEWGKVVEAQGHLSGALEIFELAFELAKANGSSGIAADAARFQGKVLRTRGEWGQAFEWYEVGRKIAEEAGDPGKLAVVLDGMANAYRDRGNLPRAAELLGEVLSLGQETGDRYALAIGHHDLMTVEKLREDLVSAAHHGWLAVQSYESKDGRLRALFDLAGVLREGGELSAAWDAYSVVVGQVEGLEARILALDALAFVAALRLDQETHAALRKRMDAEGWESVAPVFRGQVLFYRGLSCRALGEMEQSRSWLLQALGFAEEHGLNKLIFDAEAALEEGTQIPALQNQEPVYRDAPPEEILGVRRGLREMKEALAGAEGGVG